MVRADDVLDISWDLYTIIFGGLKISADDVGKKTGRTTEAEKC